MSNRPLRDGELFEIQIERMVERWSGSIEAGVTLIRQDRLFYISWIQRQLKDVLKSPTQNYLNEDRLIQA